MNLKIKEYPEILNKYFVFWLLIFAFTLTLSKSINTIIMVVVYLQVFVLSILSRHFRVRILSSMLQPLSFVFFLYLIVSLVGVSYSKDIIEGLRRTKTIVNLIFIYTMIATLLDIDARQNSAVTTKLLFFAFFLGLLLLNLIGFLNYFGVLGHTPHVLPLRPLNVHHIWFGNLNAIAIYIVLLCLFFLRSSLNNIERIFLILITVIFFISMLMSLSRTAWLAFVVSFFVMLFCFLRRNRKILLVAILGFLFGILGLYYSNNWVHQRVCQVVSDINNYKQGIKGTSIGSRFVMWSASIKMFLSNPLFGVGTGDYVLTVKKYVQAGNFPSFIVKYNHPHNVFFFVMATLGLIGLFSLFLLLYKVISCSKMLILSGRKFYGYTALIVTFHMFLSGLTENVFYIHMLLSVYTFVVGICIRKSLLSSF